MTHGEVCSPHGVPSCRQTLRELPRTSSRQPVPGHPPRARDRRGRFGPRGRGADPPTRPRNCATARSPRGEWANDGPTGVRPAPLGDLCLAGPSSIDSHRAAERRLAESIRRQREARPSPNQAHGDPTPRLREGLQPVTEESGEAKTPPLAKDSDDLRVEERVDRGQGLCTAGSGGAGSSRLTSARKRSRRSRRWSPRPARAAPSTARSG